MVLASAPKGSRNWTEATTAREAIRRALLLPPRKLPAWLNEAAIQAESEITAQKTNDATTERSSASS